MEFAKKLFLTSILIFNIQAYANCEDVNLYEENSILDSMKIANQAQVATCYAQTTAQMSEYHLKENGQSDEVRGLWVALIHKMKRKIHWAPGRLDYSLLSWAIEDFKSIGNCNIADYEMAMKKVKGQNNISDDDMVDFLNQVYKQYKKNLVSLKKDSLNKAFNTVSSSAYFKGKINHSVAAINSMPKYVVKGFLNYLKDMTFSNCSNLDVMKNQLPEVISGARGMETDEQVMQMISNGLTSSKPQPVGIGYCSNIFDNEPGTLAVTKRPRLLSMITKAAKCSAHYSVAVGQRSNNGKCEILIRNSYGEGSWAKNRVCYCENSAKERVECSSNNVASDMRVLGCWVPAKELAQNTFDLSYFVK